MSPVREVKHKHHNHLILDSAKEVNNDVLACFFFLCGFLCTFFWWCVAVWVVVCLFVCFLIVGFFKNSNHQYYQMS